LTPVYIFTYNSTLQACVRFTFDITEVQHDDDEEYVEPAMKRRKCQVSFCKGNKTKDTCVKCKKAVCGVCTARVMTRNVCMKCENDSGDDNDDETVTYSLG